MKRVPALLVCALMFIAMPDRAFTQNRPEQYKRVHQGALRDILFLRPERAAEAMERFAEEYGDDAETQFMLALASRRMGESEEALEHARRAIELGLPPGRFLVGPRPLTPWPELLRELADEFDGVAGAPLHGPMVGAVTDTAARFWVRTARPAEVYVLLAESADADEPRVSQSARSTMLSDFTAVAEMDGLEPDTLYHYQVVVGGGDGDDPAFDPREEHRFRTFPEEGEPAKFTLAFGGCAGYVPQHEHMWNTIGEFDPIALLLLGDNVYIDAPKSTNMQRYTYYRRQSRPEFRRLTGSTPTFSIWDDHDFGLDDALGGAAPDEPYWKPYVWRIFKQNWANPGYGGGAELPGCWYDFAIGDVHFIMLDGRAYRTDQGRFGGDGVENPTMLGPAQKQWLKETLTGSDATFKVLVSPVPWTFHAKPGPRGVDTWRGYREEREEIFSFIEDNDIEGVVLMSADRHRSDAWKIERPDTPGSYDLYEFNSARLTNQHVHPEMDDAIFSYNEKQSFGLVTFDTTADDPTVTYEVVNIDGKKMHELTVKRSELE